MAQQKNTMSKKNTITLDFNNYWLNISGDNMNCEQIHINKQISVHAARLNSDRIEFELIIVGQSIGAQAFHTTVLNYPHILNPTAAKEHLRDYLIAMTTAAFQYHINEMERILFLSRSNWDSLHELSFSIMNLWLI